MSAFDQDITEEERHAGFDPGAQGDETFSLEKIDEYPGILPELEFDEEPLIPAPEGQEFQSEEEPVLEESSDEPVDLPDENDSSKDLESETTSSSDDDIESLSEEELALLGSTEGLGSDEDDTGFSDENLDDEIEVVQDFGDIETVEEEVGDFADIETSSPDDGSDSIQDAGLIELLESELERSKKRKKGDSEGSQQSQESQPQFDPETGERIYADDEIEVVEDPSQNFDDEIEVVEDDGMPQFADFDEKEAFGKVSGEEAIGQESDLNQSETEMTNRAVTTDEEEETEHKPKIKRKLRLSTVLILSTMFIAIIVLIWLAFNYWELLKPKPKPVVKEEIVKKPRPKKELKLRLLDNPDEKLEFSDTSEFDLKIPSLIMPDSNQVIYEVAYDVAELEVPDPKKIETTSDVKFVRKKRPEETQQTDQRTNDIAKNKQNKVSNSRSKPDKKRVIRRDPNRKQRSRKGLFSVQIHVTASKDDAKEWLSKLSEKGLSGFITEKIVRDQVWYRVRFGEFKTYEDAYTAAINAGFDGTWIDRLD